MTVFYHLFDAAKMSVLSINNLFWQILTIETLFVSGHSFGDIQISDFLKIISTTTNIRKYKPVYITIEKTPMK